MKYDLRKIMLRTWKNYRKAHGEITFAEALHRAWLSAKAEIIEVCGITMLLLSAHIFRHTYCSRMAEGGMSPKVLQGIVGHESITTTMDVYTDLDFEVVREQADEIDKRIQRIG